MSFAFHRSSARRSSRSAFPDARLPITCEAPVSDAFHEAVSSRARLARLQPVRTTRCPTRAMKAARRLVALSPRSPQHESVGAAAAR